VASARPMGATEVTDSDDPSGAPARRVRAAVRGAAAGALALLSACQVSPPRGPSRLLPASIPAVQQWHAQAQGEFRLGDHARIIRAPRAAADLETTSRLLAADLCALFGRDFPQLIGSEAAAQPGDIYLALEPSEGAGTALPAAAAGPEAYSLGIGEHLTISAATDAGVFYGTQTVLQVLRESQQLPYGVARDWPLKPERGLSVDYGRKFFTPAWLREEVSELAYFKLNTLHLHLTDNDGFRLESRSHPEIVSREHLTRQEVRDLIAFAAERHVTLIPEIDMPGHMAAILAAHPELQLYGSAAHTPPAPGSPNYGLIDLSNPKAYTLMKDLLEEYLPLFPGPYWHIGADEYVTDYAKYPQLLAYARARYGPGANAKDTFLGFINWADALVRAAGKTTRVWNDGLGGGAAVKVNPDVVVDYWMSYGPTPQQLVDAGHLIANESWDPTYYVTGYGTGNGRSPDLPWVYGVWQPDIFQNGQTIRANDRARNLGSMLNVWCDNVGYETQTYIAGRIAEPLRVLAQRLWGSPKPTRTYAEFEDLSARLGSHPDTAPR
jgi:hexosaminidase